jgi:Tfp pilus assembly protein PilV
MSRGSGFSSQRGFSLLEVLLAGFILFLVLSSMTLVYRGAILSSAKAESAITFTSSIMPIKQLIADRLRGQGGETLSG